MYSQELRKIDFSISFRHFSTSITLGDNLPISFLHFSTSITLRDNLPDVVTILNHILLHLFTTNPYLTWKKDKGRAASQKKKKSSDGNEYRLARIFWHISGINLFFYTTNEHQILLYKSALNHVLWKISRERGKGCREKNSRLFKSTVQYRGMDTDTKSCPCLCCCRYIFNSARFAAC